MRKGQLDFRPRLFERGSELIAAPDELGCVDLSQHLVLPDDVADIHLLADQIARDLGVKGSRH
jgi:hypothetical protein